MTIRYLYSLFARQNLCINARALPPDRDWRKAQKRKFGIRNVQMARNIKLFRPRLSVSVGRQSQPHYFLS